MLNSGLGRSVIDKISTVCSKEEMSPVKWKYFQELILHCIVLCRPPEKNEQALT